MNCSMPEYLAVPADRLGEGTPVVVQVVEGMEGVAAHMAQAMLSVFMEARAQGRAATLIVPVGPVDQFPILAELINRERLDWRDVLLVNMDEYLTDGDRWIEKSHPLSFRGYMDRKFYDLVDERLAPRPENRLFPHPDRCEEIAGRIAERGSVDACFGGIGINGHVAFNEPPEADEEFSCDGFAALPTRSLDLTRETRTINSVTVGGEISVIPRRAVTVGMAEILGSRQLRFYCNRPWQRAVVRRVLHGPITPACPASFLRTHPDARLTVADYVAEPPDIALR
ncbi:MAG: sugar phosphate isomerase family [Thermoguttaceae bacterium]